jgi:hypothetical protein
VRRPRLIDALSAVVLFAIAGSLATPVFAEQVPQLLYEQRRGLSDRWNIRAGTFVKNFTTVARLDQQELNFGTEIPLEDVLGLERDSHDFSLDGYYRLGRKQRLVFGFTDWRRSSTVTLSEEIDWGEIEFPPEAQVTTSFDEWMLKFAWKYSVINNGTIDFGFSAGLTTFNYKIALSGDARVTGPNGEVGTEFAIEEQDLIAPVPLVGGHFEWTIRPRLFLSLTGEWFRIKIGDLKAGVSDAQVSVDYYFTKNFGIGVGYHVVKTDVLESENPVFELDYDVSGSKAYINFAF